jgi:ABC-type uncharacterized transport system permease subunit
MNFEDMKKIWDTQNNQPLYVIDEAALGRSINAKKNSTKKTTSLTEWVLIMANLFGGSVIMVTSYLKNYTNLAALAMGIMMLLTAVYLFVLRTRRIRRDHQFDSSILGDLNNAIENINYRVSLSRSMIWYGGLVAIFTLYSVIDSEKSTAFILAVSAFFVVGLFLSRLEYKYLHLGKKNKLLALKDKLINELEFERD